MATIDRLRSGAGTGLRLRPFAGEADLADMARIINDEAAAEGLIFRTSVLELRAEYAHASDAFDAARDVTVAELDGRIVGLGWRSTVGTTDGQIEHRVDGAVDPAFRRRGVGRALFEENMARHRAVVGGSVAVADRPRIFGSWSGDAQAGDNAILEAAGFEVKRWFFDMVRPTLDDVPDVPMPDGLEIRPIDPALARKVWYADIEAFEDHWGGFDTSEEHLDRWLANPLTDLSLWVIAFDGDEVAGGIINAIDPEENALTGFQRGLLQSVFTRRPWRRRGLATALIARSLVLLRERGMTSARLGVDAENPSGALGLYEGTGFEVATRSRAWRRPFQVDR